MAATHQTEKKRWSKEELKLKDRGVRSNTMAQNLAQYVTVETSMGTFKVELYTQHAPRTCQNFLELSRMGYYNETIFHRVIKDFMVQGGDPSGTGRGGESIYGGKFEDEICRDLKHTGAGVLSMANAGPNSNGSQFFVSLAPTPWLDGKHTIFGRVCEGMSIVQRLGSVPTVGGTDRPVSDVVVFKTYPSADMPVKAIGNAPSM